MGIFLFLPNGYTVTIGLEEGARSRPGASILRPIQIYSTAPSVSKIERFVNIEIIGLLRMTITTPLNEEQRGVEYYCFVRR